MYSRKLIPLFAFLLSTAALAAPTVTTALSSLKVRPTDALSVQSTAEIHAAKNEYEAFQVVVQGGASGVTGLTVSKPHLVGPGGAAIPDGEVRLYREQMTQFSNASSIDGAAGQWPDALVPDEEDGAGVQNSGGTWSETTSTNEHRNAFPATVAANKNLVVFVDVHVPANATAGTYTGTLGVSGQSGGSAYSADIAVTLVVRPFAIPSTSSLPTLFQTSIDNVCRAHGDVDGSGYCPSKADQRVWNRLYARFMLDHRVSLQLTDSPDTSNFTASGVAYDSAYGSLINGTDAKSRLAGAQITTVEYPWWAYGSSNGTDQTNRMSAWASHAKTNGWFTRTLDYSGDEPGSPSAWSTILSRAGWAHTADANFRTLVTTPINDYLANAGMTSNAVNVMTVVLDNLDGPSGSAYYGNQRDLAVGDMYASFLAHNTTNEVWAYQSCDQHGCASSNEPSIKNWADLMVDATGVQNRSEPWMHFIYGATGMLYYDTTYALPKAWNTDGLWAFTGNGDGTLVYPGTPSPVPPNTVGIGGTTHIPVASLRLKMLREGLEDYEYLVQCNAVDSAKAKSIARSLFVMTGRTPAGRETGAMTSAAGYPGGSPAAWAQTLESAREALATCITGNVTTDPVSPPSTPTADGGSSDGGSGGTTSPIPGGGSGAPIVDPVTGAPVTGTGLSPLSPDGGIPSGRLDSAMGCAATAPAAGGLSFAVALMLAALALRPRLKAAAAGRLG